jgi:hypothetical protein
MAIKELTMTVHETDGATSVEGKDIRGKVVTLMRSNPEQLSLFQTFLPDDEDKYSNTIDYYDSIPKYFPNKHMSPMRIQDTFLPNVTRDFERNGVHVMLTIRPARVSYKDGSFKEFYPSYREELVEEALRKISADRLNGVYLNGHAGVQFTLYELQKELKMRGHAMNLPDLVESLKICNLASFTIEIKGEKMVQAALFPILLLSSKGDWLQNPKQTRCYVQFHPLVTASISSFSYRQYDYLTYMSYKHRLSRWLHKRLAHNYIQASLMDPYHINMSTIIRDSGAYSAPRGNNRPQEIETALNELKSKQILMNYKKEIKRGPRNAIIDITYTLFADLNFIQEVKKANARTKRTDFSVS